MKKERKNRVSKQKCSRKWEKFKGKFTERQISIGTTIAEIVYFIFLAKCIYDSDLNKQTLALLACLGIMGGLFIFYLIEYCIFDMHNADNEKKECDKDEYDKK